MLLADVVIDSNDATLEDAEKFLDCIGVNDLTRLAANVFACSVPTSVAAHTRRCVRPPLALASHHKAPLAKSRPVQFDLLLNARSCGEPFGRRRLCQVGETDYGF